MTGPASRAPGGAGAVCAVALAAGEGARLRPLTLAVPKALCPVGGVPLLDLTLARLADLGLAGPGSVAVNACHLADQIAAHLAGRAHLSREEPPALGTSGGVANLRGWIAGRAVLVCNADAYLAPEDPGAPGPGGGYGGLLAGWDGQTVRMLVTPALPGQEGEFGRERQWRFAGASLLPWRLVRDLPVRPGELVTTVWRPAEARGELEFVPHRGVFIDCGTPADYQTANLHAETAGRQH
ncbi:MAG: NTP transferase domain-containing protein [Micromonosporaceae bacterium]|nr:NTP transferase domain-containing protein [Micromonosporaceae bacterium]